MDRRNLGPQESAYKRDLANSSGSEEEMYSTVVENGKEYRIPYRMIKEVVFDSVNKDELIDFEHAARLQYRLLLNDAILRAKVEFAKLRITIIYNPEDSKNAKEKISMDGIRDFLASEGVHVDNSHAQTRDLDYYKEIYSTQFDPISVREHPPYSYTKKQWSSMRSEWDRKAKDIEEKKKQKFHEWQAQYAEQHRDEVNFDARPSEKAHVSLIRRILPKKKHDGDDKGFWFHGS